MKILLAIAVAGLVVALIFRFLPDNRDRAQRVNEREFETATGKKLRPGAPLPQTSEDVASLRDSKQPLPAEEAKRQQAINAELDRIEALKASDPAEAGRQLLALNDRLCREGQALACEDAQGARVSAAMHTSVAAYEAGDRATTARELHAAIGAYNERTRLECYRGEEAACNALVRQMRDPEVQQAYEPRCKAGELRACILLADFHLRYHGYGGTLDAARTYVAAASALVDAGTSNGDRRDVARIESALRKNETGIPASKARRANR